MNGELQGHSGGSPLLWQHLFWFFGHPEVYIAILPGMGVVSHVLANFSRKPVFGYRAMAFALCAIGFLGFLVWGHHMFVSGMNPYSGLTFSLLTMSIGVPSAIKTFNWLGTLWGGKIQFHSPMLFAIGFVSFFVTGGLSGIFLAQPALDTMLHATYYVVGHFHLVMGVASIFGIFAATYYWFPKMFGRMHGRDARRSCISGLLSRVRTASSCRCISWASPEEFDATRIRPALIIWRRSSRCIEFMTIAAFVTAAAQLIFFYNFFRSLKKGARASANPWNATTLEWITSSPPPLRQFRRPITQASIAVRTNTAFPARTKTSFLKISHRKKLHSMTRNLTMPDSAFTQLAELNGAGGAGNGGARRVMAMEEVVLLTAE